MFPYITIRWINIYMTGMGIVIALLTFIGISWYLCKAYSIQFWRLFYRLPWAIILIYLLWSYVHFALRIGLFPTTRSQLMSIISPYGYQFHFIWILLWATIAIRLFFKKIKRVENKKLYSDVLFFAVTWSLIPLWLFLLLGDDFIGRTTTGPFGVQALHTESALNRFSSVLPIWLWLSIGALILYATMGIRKKIENKVGIGMLWLWYIIVLLNIIILYQQYPRYGIVPFGEYTLDIKQYVSFIIFVIAVSIYRKRDKTRS